MDDFTARMNRMQTEASELLSDITSGRIASFEGVAAAEDRIEYLSNLMEYESDAEAERLAELAADNS